MIWSVLKSSNQSETRVKFTYQLWQCAVKTGLTRVHCTVHLYWMRHFHTTFHTTGILDYTYHVYVLLDFRSTSASQQKIVLKVKESKYIKQKSSLKDCLWSFKKCSWKSKEIRHIYFKCNSSSLGPKKSKMTPNARVEGNIENESCSSTWVDPKTVVKPYSNPQTSPIGPHKTKTTPKLSQIQMSEFK